MDWIDLAAARDSWPALVTSVTNLRVPYSAGYFLTEELLASQEGFCSMKVVS